MIVSSFIIQNNVITIVNYDRQTFIVQATGFDFCQKITNSKEPRCKIFEQTQYFIKTNHTPPISHLKED